jgi:F-type H+-transporting ATPase subunit a
MGRITWDSRPPFHTARALVALLALLLGALPVARAAEPQDNEGAGAVEAAKQEEKSALEHVMDSYEIELFESFGPRSIPLPHYTFFKDTGHPLTLGLSKFMLLEVIAAGLVAAFYIPLARRMSSGALPAGWTENVREVLLTFIRDDVARPGIGHDADKYVPFLWTLFLFILFNNLLGLIPFCGSATGNIYVTAGLALSVFFALHGSAMVKMGFGHYVASMWPHMEVPYGLGYILKPLIFALEWLGVLVRNAVLAVRLFANMFAGHVVLATILIFIYATGFLFRESPVAHWSLWGTVSVLSVLAQVALSLLELFVAVLQAYIFTFLTAIFMGMALHPAH